MTFRVVLDANVLVPARLRDVLLTLGEVGLYVPLWSNFILTEMLRHLPDRVDESSRAALVDAMNRAFPDALLTWPSDVVLSGAGMVNEKDRHVATAVVFGHADALLTEDVRLLDEASTLCDTHRVAEFLAYTVDVSPLRASSALSTMVRRFPEAESNDPEEMWERLLRWFDKQGWSAAADILRATPREP